MEDEGGQVIALPFMPEDDRSPKQTLRSSLKGIPTRILDLFSCLANRISIGTAWIIFGSHTFKIKGHTDTHEKQNAFSRVGK